MPPCRWVSLRRLRSPRRRAGRGDATLSVSICDEPPRRLPLSATLTAGPRHTRTRLRTSSCEETGMDFGIFTFATDRDMNPGALAVEVEARAFDRLLFTEHSHIPVARETPYPAVYGGGLLP